MLTRLRKWLNRDVEQERIETAAGILVARHIEMGGGTDHKTTHEFMRCKLQGTPVGSWRITVEPLPTDAPPKNFDSHPVQHKSLTTRPHNPT